MTCLAQSVGQTEALPEQGGAVIVTLSLSLSLTALELTVSRSVNVSVPTLLVNRDSVTKNPFWCLQDGSHHKRDISENLVKIRPIFFGK